MRAPVQFEEGCGVEDAIDLRRKSTTGTVQILPRAEAPPGNFHWLPLFRDMMQRPFFLRALPPAQVQVQPAHLLLHSPP